MTNNRVDQFLKVQHQHRNVKYLVEHFKSEQVLDKVLVTTLKKKMYNELYDCFVAAIMHHSEAIVKDAMALCDERVLEVKELTKNSIDDLFEELVEKEHK